MREFLDLRKVGKTTPNIGFYDLILGVGKRGALQKGCVQEGPLSRDARKPSALQSVEKQGESNHLLDSTNLPEIVSPPSTLATRPPFTESLRVLWAPCLEEVWKKSPWARFLVTPVLLGQQGVAGR